MFGFVSPTHYIIVATFGHVDWYLVDANADKKITVREWTAKKNIALHFDKKVDAEQTAKIVCSDKTYKISGIWVLE